MRSSFQRAVTRIPVDIASIEPASTACIIAVSAPSSFTSANANGFAVGACRSARSPRPTISTTPPGPDGDEIGRVERVAGIGVPLGGWHQHPAVGRADPEDLPSRKPVRNGPTTGPRVRVYGNSMTWVEIGRSATAGVEHIPIFPGNPGARRAQRRLRGGRRRAAARRSRTRRSTASASVQPFTQPSNAVNHTWRSTCRSRPCATGRGRPSRPRRPRPGARSSRAWHSRTAGSGDERRGDERGGLRAAPARRAASAGRTARRPGRRRCSPASGRASSRRSSSRHVSSWHAASRWSFDAK